MKNLIMLVTFVGFLILGASCEYHVWKDCRQDHGRLFCMRVLG